MVQSVEIEGVWVNWQCKASCDESVIDAKEDNGVQQPKCYVTGDDLQRMKRLNLYESCMLQINDKNFLKIEAEDQIVRKSHWKKEQNSRFRILREHLQQKMEKCNRLTVESIEKVIRIVFEFNSNFQIFFKLPQIEKSSKI